MLAIPPHTPWWWASSLCWLLPANTGLALAATRAAHNGPGHLLGVGGRGVSRLGLVLLGLVRLRLLRLGLLLLGLHHLGHGVLDVCRRLVRALARLARLVQAAHGHRVVAGAHELHRVLAREAGAPAAGAQAVHERRPLEPVLGAELAALLGVVAHVAAAARQRHHLEALGLVARASHLLHVAALDSAGAAGHAVHADAQWHVEPEGAWRVHEEVLVTIGGS
mmetsp:Transcript_18758/g.47588  ORF Transcript_18758/g.47588 Transcript_18758/m.47588 type:complete len:222 (-) Transcript_18758:172-837(-)